MLEEYNFYGVKISNMTIKRDEWSNQMVFVLAAAGSAVGLGNIWRFPYITGENGGGAFVLIYLLCVIIIGVPIMVAELMIGRAGKQSPALAFKNLGGKFGKYWKWFGGFSIFAAFFLSSYYSVIGGWTLCYVYKSFAWHFADMDKNSTLELFTSFTADPISQIFWTVLFVLLGIVVVARGLKNGLEAFNKIFMPILLAMVILLVINSLTCKGAIDGLTYLFEPDFSRINSNTVLAAMGQAFFSLSLGMGAIMTYGSYLSKETDLIKTSFIIVSLDTLVAILVGIAIFPVIFAAGMNPEAGPGLTFITLPVAFSNFGDILGPILISIFFLILSFAALTSSISVLEPVVAHFVDKEIMGRKLATTLIGIGVFILAIPAALSNGANKFLSEHNFLGKSYMDFADFIVSDNLLPIGGFAIAMFVLFVIAKHIRHQQVKTFYNIWKPLLFIGAIAVAVVYLAKAFEENFIWFGIASALILVIAILAYLTKYPEKNIQK